MQQFYGVDGTTLSARRLLLLVDQLPPEARTWSTQGWGVDRELAAQTLETLATLLELTAQANAKKPRPVKPTSLPRPWDVKKRPGSARDAVLKLAGQLSTLKPRG